jgi:hypothetical protein
MRKFAALLLCVSLGLLALLWPGTPVSSRAPAPIKHRPPVRLPRFLPGQDVLAVLDKPVDFGGLDDPKTTLIEALDQLSKVHRITFDVNETAFAADDLKDVLKTEIANPNAIAPMKVLLSTVLRKILCRVPAKSGATFFIRRDHVEITTVAAQRAELGIKDGVPMLPLVHLTADRRALDEALSIAADQANRNVAFDPRISDKVRTPVTAHLMNTPFDAAMFLLTDMAELSFVQIDGVFYVTSPERVATIKANWSRHRPAPAAKPPETKKK